MLSERVFNIAPQREHRMETRRNIHKISPLNWIINLRHIINVLCCVTNTRSGLSRLVRRCGQLKVAVEERKFIGRRAIRLHRPGDNGGGRVGGAWRRKITFEAKKLSKSVSKVEFAGWERVLAPDVGRSCHTNQVATHHRSNPSDDFTRTFRARWQLIWLNDTFHLDLIFPIHNEAVVNAAETSGPVNGMLWQLLQSESRCDGRN